MQSSSPGFGLPAIMFLNCLQLKLMVHCNFVEWHSVVRFNVLIASDFLFLIFNDF